VHERAGTLALASDLIDVEALVADYFRLTPDPSNPAQRVVFGTSGHRGSAFDAAFNEAHIAAITQAIVEYRASQGITGPVLVARDTHALSEPAEQTVLRVLAGNGVVALADSRNAPVPTPALSHAVIRLNRLAAQAGDPNLADGIVLTPSHNPPRDGGIKYNPPHGGPADTDATSWIANRANALIEAGLVGVRRAEPNPEGYDFREHYVADLGSVLDMDAIAASGLRIGADPLGGASAEYWQLIAERYGLNLDVVNPEVDPRWPFMSLDWDGKIRMDCSSPYAMAGVLARQAEYDILTGNDADADRHGIVTRDGGLMNPNHFLAVAIDYLYRHRPDWPADAGVGKTLVSSSMIDRVVAALGRPLIEVPVGFKWFVPGLVDGSVAFGGEESAGASFLRKDGSVWSTDKDGLLLCLLAAEIQAVTGLSPSERYEQLVAEHGRPAYARQDAPADAATKAALGKLNPAAVTTTHLGGDPIIAVLTEAPGNGAGIGGLKVVTEFAWFAARPSGTEDVAKVYAESFRGPEHLSHIQAEAQAVVRSVTPK